MLLLQLEVPLATVERAAQLAAANHVPVMLDPAPARSLPRALLRNVAWLTPNESEAAALCGDPTSSPPTMGRVRAYADELQSRTGAHVVIKLGARGAFIAGPENRRDYVPAFKVRAVDATAAGDAFNGGLAVALTQGRDGLDALRFASAVAALSVTRRGAQPSMPSAVEVEKFLRRARVAPAQLDH
jgi:ribokinase